MAETVKYPPLPPGFVMDDIPPPPPGFVIDDSFGGKAQSPGAPGSADRIAAMKVQPDSSGVPAWGQKSPSGYASYKLATESLPVVGGMIGGALGGTGGTFGGIGVGGVPGAIAGATIGGAAGESAKQMLDAASGVSSAPKTPGKAAGSIAEEGAIQGAFTAAGPAISYAAKGLGRAFTGRTIEDLYAKAISPSVGSTGSNAAETARYYERANDALKTVAEYSPKDELPKSLKELSEAILSAKVKVFNEYNDLAKQAGQSGASIKFGSAISELEKMANDPVFSVGRDKSAARYAMETANDLKEIQAKGGYSPEQAQRKIKEINARLQSFYKSGSGDPGKNTVDAILANNLRKEMDETVSGITGEQYQTLKNKYGSLSTIEKDVNKRANVFSRRQDKGFFDLTDVFTADQAVSAIARGDIAGLAGAGAMGLTKKVMKAANNPDTKIKRIFKTLEKSLGEKSTPEDLIQIGEPGFRETRKITAAFNAADVIPGVNPEIVATLPPELQRKIAGAQKQLQSPRPVYEVSPGGEAKIGGPETPYVIPPALRRKVDVTQAWRKTIPEERGGIVESTLGRQPTVPSQFPMPTPVKPKLFGRPGDTSDNISRMLFKKSFNDLTARQQEKVLTVIYNAGGR